VERIETDLSKFNNRWFKTGAPFILRFFWYWINAIFIKSSIPGSAWRCFLLRLYGAKIGVGVVIKPCVNIKYPWNLQIGDYSWIGENVWIDNLTKVEIGNHCCISQGALLLCGNHNYKKQTFDLMVGTILLENGVWVGAKSVVTANVILKSHSVLAAGSIAIKNTEPYWIYAGNPAEKIRERIIEA
jgi:putative colanic acid biosynthesis acetyltransferase WcaF